MRTKQKSRTIPGSLPHSPYYNYTHNIIRIPGSKRSVLRVNKVLTNQIWVRQLGGVQDRRYTRMHQALVQFDREQTTFGFSRAVVAACVNCAHLYHSHRIKSQTKCRSLNCEAYRPKPRQIKTNSKGKTGAGQKFTTHYSSVVNMYIIYSLESTDIL